MKRFRAYVDHLKVLLGDARQAQSVELHPQIAAALDGQPKRELRRIVPLARRRAAGAFFTGPELAKTLLSQIPVSEMHDKIVFDPTCGVGDLLLQTALHLPVEETLQQTLIAWGTCLAGTDIHETFVQATRLRLALLAINRGARSSPSTRLAVTSSFPMIRVGNALIETSLYQTADLILLNPPFNLRQAPKDCSWATGTITAAALFCEHAIKSVGAGAAIHTILPDVLRSGSRYSHWREFVSNNCVPVRLAPFGQFEPAVDVDVFIGHFQKGPCTSPRATWWPQSTRHKRTVLANFFDVTVGTVVPFRDKCIGPSRHYIHAQSLPRWERIDSITETRRYNGKVIQPPFVAIRRTSRPDDHFRAVATVVAGNKPVAVENHLIVCQPHDGTIKSCSALMRQLKTIQINKWLNRRIRCRHLTVTAIRELPITFS